MEVILHKTNQMKNILLIIFILIVVTNFCVAQITITNANMPSNSDTIRYSNTSPAGINYDTTGANLTWDFSAVTPINQGLYEYKPSLLINPVYIFFGLNSYGLKILDSLNLGLFSISNVYDFYRNTSASFRAVGRGLEFGGVPIPSNYTDDDEIYQFPLQYNDFDSSTYAVSFTLSNILNMDASGYRINEVEGYGSVITPYGTFSCLKVKTTLVETDLITINAIPLPPITRTTRQYKWLTTSEKIPVFEVAGTVFAGNFIPTYARYRDNYNIPVGFNEFSDQKHIIIYPNPASQNISLSGLQFIADDEIVITDVTGKKFYQTTVLKSATIFSIATGDFPKGIYFLTLRKSGSFYSDTFIKE